MTTPRRSARIVGLTDARGASINPLFVHEASGIIAYHPKYRH